MQARTEAAERLRQRREAEKMDAINAASEENEVFEPMTIQEIRLAVDELQDSLPMEIDDDLLLAEITVDFNGSVSFWYRASDDLTKKFRKIGWETFKQNAQDAIAKSGANFDKAPPKLKRLLEQNHISLQYIFEDRYESHLGSYSLNQAALDGDFRTGNKQTNPFAVRNVSASGD